MTDYAVSRAGFPPAFRRARRHSNAGPLMLALAAIAFTLILLADTPVWYPGAGADLAVVGLVWAIYGALMAVHSGPLQRRSGPGS